MEKHEKIQKNRSARTRAIVFCTLLAIAGSIGFYNNQFFGNPTTLSLNSNELSTITSIATLRRKQSEHLDADPAANVEPTEAELVGTIEELDAGVRAIKDTGVFMEIDPEGLKASKALQDATRKLLARRYGSREPYRVRVELTFQASMPDFDEKGEHGEFTIELAPSQLVPHSIYSFLEIARNWKSGAFHRRAGHVLQVMVNRSPVKHLAFQEYSDQYPHRKGTVGYAGRPSGPEWYVSIQDNTKNHGPGSQQKRNPYEADSCFGTVVEGFEDVVLGRITKMGGTKGMGFIEDPKQHVIIANMIILVPDSTSPGQYVEWKE